MLERGERTSINFYLIRNEPLEFECSPFLDQGWPRKNAMSTFGGRTDFFCVRGILAEG